MKLRFLSILYRKEALETQFASYQERERRLLELYEEGVIGARAALDKAIDKSSFKDLLEKPKGPAAGA